MASLQYTKSSTNQTVTLGAGYTSGSGSMTLTAGNGAYLPASGDFWLSYNNGAGVIRIFKVTARSTDTLTVTAVSGEGSGDGNISSGETLRWALSVDALDQLRADICQTGTYAAATSTKAGSIYLPTDSLYFLRDTGSTFAGFGPFVALTAPSSSGWSWVNQGSASLTETGGVDYIYAPPLAGDSAKIRTRTAPGTPYTLVAGICTWATDNNYNRSGVGFRESATGKLIAGVVDQGKTMGYIKYNSPTSFSGNGSYLTVGARQFWFFKLTYDGTTITISCSLDMGMSWYQLLSEPKATFFTTAPNELFFYADANNGTYPSGTTLFHWKES